MMAACEAVAAAAIVATATERAEEAAKAATTGTVASAAVSAKAAVLSSGGKKAAASAAVTETTAATTAAAGGAGAVRSAAAAKLLSLSGVFAVYKPKGPTSAELLNQLKEKLLAEAGMPPQDGNKRKKQALKIGHGGTLDSAATGVLDLSAHRHQRQPGRSAGRVCRTWVRVEHSPVQAAPAQPRSQQTRSRP